MDKWDLFDKVQSGFAIVFALGIFIFILGALTAMFADYGFPASGSAIGYISFHEKHGFWQKDTVCWRDTPYAECDSFDPLGKNYPPDHYMINYTCDWIRFNWDRATRCSIDNAVKVV